MQLLECAATVQGAVQDVAAEIESLAAAVCTIDVSANLVRLRVTGDAATDLIWLGTVRYMKIPGTV